MAILILDKVNFRQKNYPKERGEFHNDKKTISPKNIINVSVYATN